MKKIVVSCLIFALAIIVVAPVVTGVVIDQVAQRLETKVIRATAHQPVRFLHHKLERGWFNSQQEVVIDVHHPVLVSALNIFSHHDTSPQTHKIQIETQIAHGFFPNLSSKPPVSPKLVESNSSFSLIGNSNNTQRLPLSLWLSQGIDSSIKVIAEPFAQRDQTGRLIDFSGAELSVNGNLHGHINAQAHGKPMHIEVASRRSNKGLNLSNWQFDYTHEKDWQQWSLDASAHELEWLVTQGLRKILHTTAIETIAVSMNGQHQQGRQLVKLKINGTHAIHRSLNIPNASLHVTLNADQKALYELILAQRLFRGKRIAKTQFNVKSMKAMQRMFAQGLNLRIDELTIDSPHGALLANAHLEFPNTRVAPEQMLNLARGNGTVTISDALVKEASRYWLHLKRLVALGVASGVLQKKDKAYIGEFELADGTFKANGTKFALPFTL